MPNSKLCAVMCHMPVVKDLGTLSLKTNTQFSAILALTVVKITQLRGTLDLLFFRKILCKQIFYRMAGLLHRFCETDVLTFLVFRPSVDELRFPRLASWSIASSFLYNFRFIISLIIWPEPSFLSVIFMMGLLNTPWSFLSGFSHPMESPFPHSVAMIVFPVY